MTATARWLFGLVLCLGACTAIHPGTRSAAGASLAPAIRELATKDWRSTAAEDLASLWPQDLVAERPAIAGERGTQGFFAAPFRPPCPETNVFLFLGTVNSGRRFEPRSLRTVTFWRSLASPEEAKHEADRLLSLLGIPHAQEVWSPWTHDSTSLVLQGAQGLTKETAMARIERETSCWTLMLTWTRFWDKAVAPSSPAELTAPSLGS